MKILNLNNSDDTLITIVVDMIVALVPVGLSCCAIHTTGGTFTVNHSRTEILEMLQKGL